MTPRRKEFRGLTAPSASPCSQIPRKINRRARARAVGPQSWRVSQDYCGVGHSRAKKIKSPTIDNRLRASTEKSGNVTATTAIPSQRHFRP